MTARHDESRTSGAGSCFFFVDRRAFLRATALGVLGALAGESALPTLARAVETTTPMRSRSRAELRYVVPPDDGVAVDEGNEVILVRWQGRAYAFSAKCPHRGGRLEWRAAESRVYCPKHKARFRADGAHDSGRQSRDLDRFDIRQEGGALVIRRDALRRADTDPAGWAAAVVTLG
jgi:nitrite reductase/ring-hydroxylating ferredoxin subunit